MWLRKGEIRATAFNDAVDAHYEKLQENGVRFLSLLMPGICFLKYFRSIISLKLKLRRPISNTLMCKMTMKWLSMPTRALFLVKIHLPCLEFNTNQCPSVISWTAQKMPPWVRINWILNSDFNPNLWNRYYRCRQRNRRDFWIAFKGNPKACEMFVAWFLDFFWFKFYLAQKTGIDSRWQLGLPSSLDTMGTKCRDFCTRGLSGCCY